MAANLSAKILNLPRLTKRAVALVVDTVLCICTVAIAYLLRLDTWVFPVSGQWLSYAAALVFALPLFVTFGLYRAIFRHAGWGALTSVVRACTVYGLSYSFVFTLIGVKEVPRTIGILQPILLFLAIGASRAVASFWLSGGYQARLRRESRRVLIYGAGSSGRQLAAGLASSSDMQVIGFVDDQPLLHGSVLNGKAIYAGSDLINLIDRFDISDVLLALPSATRQRRNEIIENLRGASAAIRTLPGLMDLAHGRVTVNDLRELDIEDLLGRDPVPPNSTLLSKCIFNKTVLITGAGGSIGSELCRQILALQPKTLLLLELSEYNLYFIHQELIENNKVYSTNIVPLLGSIQEESRVREILLKWRPQTIYHAAAYKHVPLVESNPIEGIRNNIWGTLTIARLADLCGVSDFVLISTDKAVRPTNVMGATKRVAEQVLQALAANGATTRFSMVRFGNVLGSSGSVVPLFRRQIRAGGPITITHEEITRFFMTIPEAAQLVIQAGAMAKGGEVFVLDMGEPVRILDLAKRMVELSGLAIRDAENSGGDIEIDIVGLRPGEKLYEELLIGENPHATEHSRIMMANESFYPWETLEAELEQLEGELKEDRIGHIRLALRRLVPEFSCVDEDELTAPVSGAAGGAYEQYLKSQEGGQVPIVGAR